MRPRLVIGASAVATVAATLGLVGFVDAAWGIAVGIALLAVHSSLLAHFVIRQLQRSSRNAERFHRESSRRVKRLSDANERMERKVGDNAEALRTVKRSLNLTAQAVDAQRAVSTEIFVRTHGLAQPAPGRATAEADV